MMRNCTIRFGYEYVVHILINNGVILSTKIKELQLILKKKSYSNILENFKTQDKEFNQY